MIEALGRPVSNCNYVEIDAASPENFIPLKKGIEGSSQSNAPLISLSFQSYDWDYCVGKVVELTPPMMCRVVHGVGHTW